MRGLLAAGGLLLPLAAFNSQAATAYVTDELVLGVYAAQNTQGQRLATLHSGATVETLSASGDSTEVRLADGTTGWVKTAYLTNTEPATLRIKQLQEELDRSRATTPALAEAAERSEVERLTRELAEQTAATANARSASSNGAVPASATPTGERAPTALRLAPSLAAVAAALVVGFWLGYAALARRIKRKFGGIKVY
jgi:transposase-like protein